MHDIPRRYSLRLERKHGNNYVNIPSLFEDEIGLTVDAYLSVVFAIVMFYMMKYERFIKPSSETEIGILENRKKRTASVRLLYNDLFNFIEWADKCRSEMRFLSKELLFPDIKQLTQTNIDAFLVSTSRTTHQLKLIQNQPIYQSDESGYSLSPLENYPVVAINTLRSISVKTDGSQEYVVPNIPYFIVGVTARLRHHIQRSEPDGRYLQVFGTIQEIYLEELLRFRLPNLKLIPEFRYRRRTNDPCDSPDLTIIDPDKCTLIAIESKGKMLGLGTRIHPTAANFLSSLSDVLKAFERLPEKVEDLLSENVKVINRNLKNKLSIERSISVVVVNEGIYLFNKIFEYHLRKLPCVPDWTEKLKHYIVDLSTLESYVEQAGTSGIPLYDILCSHINADQSLDNAQNDSTLLISKHDMGNAYYMRYVQDLFAASIQGISDFDVLKVYSGVFSK
jgi:hypothetical protein